MNKKYDIEVEEYIYNSCFVINTELSDNFFFFERSMLEISLIDHIIIIINIIFILSKFQVFIFKLFYNNITKFKIY